MADESTVAVYETMEQAEEAVRKLDQGRYPIKQISIVAQKLETEKEVQGFITAGDIAKQGAGIGGWVGGIFGLLMGGAFLVVPGFGPLIVGRVAGGDTARHRGRSCSRRSECGSAQRACRLGRLEAAHHQV